MGARYQPESCAAMIEAIGLMKSYPTNQGNYIILDNVSMHIGKGEKVGIIGKNGAGKSTLIRLLSGAELPTKGKIRRGMSVSWPLAFSGGFQGSLTGLDNLKFICRIYGANYHEKLDFVHDFSELGQFMKEPVKTYSSGMRARLAFALSMAIDFDCFLIDEVTAVGDSRFKRKCEIELFEKRAHKAMVFVSHNEKFIAKYCQRTYVLSNKQLLEYPDVDSAVAYYHKQAESVATRQSSREF